MISGRSAGSVSRWRPSASRRVARADIPTLVVWGDHDHVLPFSHLAAAAEALPAAETHVFAKTGHMPQIERADEFAEVVEGFLSRAA